MDVPHLIASTFFLFNQEILLFSGLSSSDSIFQPVVITQRNLLSVHHEVRIILFHVFPPTDLLYARNGYSD